MNIDITAEQKTIIHTLLQTFLPNTKVWAFGSRIKFTSRPESDLDLAAFIQPEQKTNFYALKEAFEESDLPFRVDVLDWHVLPENFKMNIEKEYVMVQEENIFDSKINGWKAYRLSEVGKIVTGKTPPTIDFENFGTEYPFITPKDMIGQKTVSTTERYLSNKGKHLLQNNLLPPKTICVSCIGSDLGKIIMTKSESLTNQQLNSIICNASFDPDFVFYALKLVSETLKSIGKSSTAVPIVNKSTFSNFELLAPDFELQQSIASILSSLDDKIELNLQMNQTFETIAQAIFKEWFVDFNFPGFDGELVDGLPKGWSEKRIGELFQTTVGGDWGKDQQDEEYSERVYVVRGTDFDNILNGNISKVPIRFIKKSNFEKREILNGDILLEISGGSKDQPTGRTILFTNEILFQFKFPVVPASFCRLIRPLNYNYSILLNAFFNRFYLIGGTWEFQNQSTGISNFQFTYFSENKTLFIPITEDLINKFSDVVKPIVIRMHENVNQIKSLTQLRDSLLPKLLTGKIPIKEA